MDKTIRLNVRVICERTHLGAWRISDTVDGHLVTRQFFGYTKREAMRLFRAETRA